MTEPSVESLAGQFARLVADVAARPAALVEHRATIRMLVRRLQQEPFTLEVGGDSSDDAVDRTLASLQARCAAYGVESFSMTSKAAEADVLDLARLLATEPTQADPVAFFAARASAIDARGIPRKLRSRSTATAPDDTAPIIESASAPIVEASSTPRGTPRGNGRLSGAPEDVELAPDLRSERLGEALRVPDAANPHIAALLAQLQDAEEIALVTEPLRELADAADLAFRTGRVDDLLDAMAGLVAIEYAQQERDASDERRREFGRAVRRLAPPLILRQLAVLRHRLGADATAAARLQALLDRYGTDGAEALIDEWATAANPASRAICLEALQGLRRTHDALFDLVRDVDDATVRVATRLLGALADARAESMLLELLRHPKELVRRDVVAALEPLTSVAALDALGVALVDDAPLVRLRAVHALAARGEAALPNLLPLLDREDDPEVLAAAVMALAAIGTPDCVQALVRVAYGESAHPRKRLAEYRLQACRALVLIRTPQAMAAVQGLRDDRDRDVRSGAVRLVAQAARRSTISMRAVSAP